MSSIPTTEMSAGTLAISSNLEHFTSDLRGTMERIDELVNDENVGRVEGILVNLDTASLDIADVAGDHPQVVRRLARKLADEIRSQQARARAAR